MRAATRSPAAAAARRSSPALAFRRGLVSDLLNVKAGLFWIALVPQFVGADSGRCSRWRWSPAMGALVFAWLTGYAYLAARLSGELRRRRSARVVNGTVGAVLLALGRAPRVGAALRDLSRRAARMSCDETRVRILAAVAIAALPACGGEPPPAPAPAAKSRVSERPAGTLVYVSGSNRLTAVERRDRPPPRAHGATVATCGPELHVIAGHVVFAGAQEGPDDVFSAPLSLDRPPIRLGSAHALRPLGNRRPRLARESGLRQREDGRVAQGDRRTAG